MKGKKLLAGVLSAAMVLSTMAVPVFADEAQTEIIVSSAEELNSAIKTAQNNESTIIDLNCNTIKLTEYIATSKNLKFENGTIDISQLKNSTGKDAVIVGYACKLEFENVDFVGEDYASGTAVLYAQGGGELLLDNCDFTLKNDSNKNGVLSGHSGKEKVTVKNCTFNLTNTGRVFKLMELDMSGSSVTAVTDKDHSDHAFRNVTGKITDSTISATGKFETGIKNDNGKSFEIAGNSSVTLSNDIILSGGAAIKVAETASLSTTGTDKRVAKIGDAYYGTFEDALAAAKENETITLVADAEINTVPNARITNAGTINLNGKKLTLNDGGIQFAGINFVGGDGDTRGTIVAANNTGYQGIFYLCWGGTMTFKNIDIDAKALKQAYVIESQNWSENNITLDNTKIDATGDETRNLSTVIAAWGGKFVMQNNSEIKVSNTTGHAINGGADVTITDSKVTAENTEDGIYHSGGSLTINGNSVVKVKDPTGNTNWNPTAAGIVLGADTPYTKANTAIVDATVYKAVAESNVADAIDVKFVPAENENVYDIVVVPTDNKKVINRLSSAEFDFELSNPDMNFEITGAENVVVTRDNNDHVLFNFDGVNAADASGVEVKLGTVTIGGFGGFTFGIKENGNNKVQTAKINDNIVYTFEGENLTVNKIEGNLEVPAYELTVNIDFPNAVNDNAAAYQDMKVTVVGGTVNKEYVLGSDECNIAMKDGKYVIKTALPENTPYTVEVSGAGYRTARYTVTMNDDKTLNFWNNAKDEAVNVEEGKDSSAKNVTFLAGELVKDGKINVYDLSAVVSYFGTVNNVTEGSPYAKYDLNRDGKIDSKDVAYVLVSWGK